MAETLEVAEVAEEAEGSKAALAEVEAEPVAEPDLLRAVPDLEARPAPAKPAAEPLEDDWSDVALDEAIPGRAASRAPATPATTQATQAPGIDLEEAVPASAGAEPRPPAAAPRPPAAAEAAPSAAQRAPDGGEADLRAALSQASREVIERVVWEVVPQLAEILIREQLDRLVSERQNR